MAGMRSERSERRTYADPCGVSRALDAVGERWALLIVRELMLGARRFGQLREGLPGMSPNVLTQRLRELEEDGVLRKYTLDPPASIPVYELTERGRALEPVLLELGRWGAAQRSTARRELSVASMLMALQTMFDPDPGLPSATYGLHLAGEDYTLALDGTSVRVSRGRPDRPTATLATDVSTLRLLAFAGTGVRAAEEAGALTITGDRRAATRFPKYFRRPPGH